MQTYRTAKQRTAELILLAVAFIWVYSTLHQTHWLSA